MAPEFNCRKGFPPFLLPPKFCNLMYGYEEYLGITPEQVLQKVSQEEIFEFVLEEPFSFAGRYKSPCRVDTKPGCRFEQRPDGTIIFVDFGELHINPNKVHRTCFGLVRDKFGGVSMETAIKIILKHFNLSDDSNDYSDYQIERTYEKKSSSEKTPTDIKYEKAIMDKFCIRFWSQFLIKPEHLREDNVFATKRISIRSQKGYKIVNLYKPSFAIDFVDAVKIYQPFSNDYRWITNCTENHIGNIDNLPATGEELIIQKSYKDHRVLRNLEMGLNVVWFQNEWVVPSMEILTNLTQRFKLISVFYDNDEDGTLGAMKMVEIFNSIRPECARMVHLPSFVNRRKTYKDPGEFIKAEGKRDLITVIHQIGIYGT